MMLISGKEIILKKTIGYLSLPILGILSITLLFGADFWEKKPFTEWTDKEITKMLTDSPWAKKVTVNSLVPAQAGGGQMAGGGGRGGGGAGGGGGGRGRGGGGGGMSAGPGAGRAGPAMEFIVRWESSLPIKQAVVRMGYQKDNPDVVEEYLSRDDPHYIVSVSVLPIPEDRINSERIAGMASLVRKKFDPVPADSAVIAGTRGGSIIYFRFPRTMNIELANKDVEFVLELPRIKIKKKFSLKKMKFGDQKLSL